MNEYVTDTHSLLWYLINSSLLGGDAAFAFDEGKNGFALIYIPAIVFCGIILSECQA